MKSSLGILEMLETLLFPGDEFFKIPENLILGIFLAEADTKKHRYASAKTPNTALVKVID